MQRLYEFAPIVMLSRGFQVSEPQPGYSGISSTSANVSNQQNKQQSETADPAAAQETTKYPECWFEDEANGVAVRWHFFAGILYDLSFADNRLPWRLKLHFNNYPTSQLLPLGDVVESCIQSMYKHSLKQALTLITTNSKAAMNVTKDSHGVLWESVRHSNWKLHHRVNLCPKRPVNFSIRLLVNESPPIQRHVAYSSDVTIRNVLNEWYPDFSSGVLKVCGIRPSLDTSIAELWHSCCHPDLFLYLILIAPT